VNGVRRFCVGALVAVVILAGGARLAIGANAVVEQPRSFGHVIGDLFTQRVLLSAGGKEFEPADLPSTGRAGVWFERRAVRVETDEQGRRWLSVTYQLMNSPPALAIVNVPAWKLKSRDTKEELSVAEWPMSVAPLTPREPFARAGLGGLRPDRAVAPIPLLPMQRGFWIGIGGFILCIAAWVAWWAWRGWKAASSQPFAVALREMGKVEGTAPEAWHALHRAFDRMAGQAIREETLPQLFRQAPHLVPMRSAIELFFSQSAARFFGGQSPQQPVGVRELCRELRRIEKRHET
jgi:mxaA protein